MRNMEAMRMKECPMTIRNRRMATVVAAPVAALIAWACIRLGGIDLVVKTGDGSVGPADAVVAVLAAGHAGWFVVRLLERYTVRPGFWWLRSGRRRSPSRPSGRPISPMASAWWRSPDSTS